MSNLIHVLETVLPVFLVLALGVLCRKKQLFSREGVNALKSVVVNLTLPAVLFNAFATSEYDKNSIIVPLVIFALCCVALVLGYAACKALKVKGKLTPYLMTGFEAGMLGYALFALLFADGKTSDFAIIDLGQVLFVFTIYKALLKGKGGIRSVAHEAFTSPVVWAIIAGLIVGASGLYKALIPSGVAGVLDSCANFLAAPTSAIILLTIGYDLVPKEIRWRETFAAVIMRVVIMAVCLGVALIVNSVILGGVMHTGALILMFILPPPYVLPVFADAQDERANISSALSVLTLVSIALFAVMSAVI